MTDGAWVLWFECDDQGAAEYTEVHVDELSALRSAMKEFPTETGTILHAIPHVTFVPFGKSINDARKSEENQNVAG